MSVFPGVTKKPIIALLWRQYIYETMYKYEICINLDSNLHHDQKKVALSPEWPEEWQLWML